MRETRNDEAFAAWVAAHEAAGRSRGARVRAARDFLVATGRAGEVFSPEVVSDEDLLHDVLLSERCEMAAKAARRADGHHYLNSRLGMHCAAAAV